MHIVSYKVVNTIIVAGTSKLSRVLMNDIINMHYALNREKCLKKIIIECYLKNA